MCRDVDSYDPGTLQYGKKISSLRPDKRKAVEGPGTKEGVRKGETCYTGVTTEVRVDVVVLTQRVQGTCFYEDKSPSKEAKEMGYLLWRTRPPFPYCFGDEESRGKSCPQGRRKIVSTVRCFRGNTSVSLRSTPTVLKLSEEK